MGGMYRLPVHVNEHNAGFPTPPTGKMASFMPFTRKSQSMNGSAAPTKASMPSLDLTAYDITRTIDPSAGEVGFQSTLIQQQARFDRFTEGLGVAGPDHFDSDRTIGGSC
jgi:hypothetical protein